MDVKVRVIKRNGEEVDFNLVKIVNAIKAANNEVDNIHTVSYTHLDVYKRQLF